MDAYRAIVIGATGAVGSALVRELLASSGCTSVVAVVRRPVDLFVSVPGADKLALRVVAMDRLEQEVPAAAAGCDVAFCTMGIGQPRKVSREEFWKVDVEYASAFARACRGAGVRHFSLLTSVGASARASSYYLKAKGTIEDAVRALGFERSSFFRPSILVTRDIRYGLQDRVTQAVFPAVSWMLPDRFHEIRVEDLARAMRLDAERPSEGSHVLHHAELQALLRGET